jgi:hypothetical protein
MTDSHMRARGEQLLADGVDHPHGLDSAGVAAVEDLKTIGLIGEVLDERLREAVTEALYYNVTWTQIGWALGLTKNGAWQRYSGLAVTNSQRKRTACPEVATTQTVCIPQPLR